VSVSNTAQPSVINTVFVSGGGELITTNDMVTDPVNIIGVPDLTAASSHQGSLGQGQIGATYTLSVTNIGGAVANSGVTLTDTLPAGLTATGIDGGTGWNCTLATLTCIAVQQITYQYFGINLTVNVSANAPPSATNTVTVSGGGETNTSNDTATDVTQILPPVSMTVFNSNGQVTAGQPASFGLAVASFAPDPVVMSCTGLPALAACSFSPPSVTGQTNTNLTITTIAPTRSAALQPWNTSAPFYAILLPLFGLVVTRLSHRRGAKTKTRIAASATLLTLLFLAACGGGGSSSTPPPPLTLHGGTPAGNYTITVTAADTAASLQGSTTVTLSVNWNGL
jgi:hypothetical protein